MKKIDCLKRVLVAGGLGLLFGFPLAASANELDYVHFPDATLRDELVYKSEYYLRDKYDQKREEIEAENQAKKEQLQTAYEVEVTRFEEIQAGYDEQAYQLVNDLKNGLISQEEYDRKYAELDKKVEELNQQREVATEKYDKDVEEQNHIYNQAHTENDKNMENEDEFIRKYELFDKKFIASVEGISPDWADPYSSLNGLEFAINLKRLTGEQSIPFADLRPINKLSKLEEISIVAMNQGSLIDLKGLTNLKKLTLSLAGYGTEEEFEEYYNNRDKMYTRTLLTDISALSNLPQLNQLSLYAEGIMTPVTLKQGTDSYQIYDPIILSSQFDGQAITYTSGLDENTDSSEELKWENLTGTEKYLPFSWSVTKGNYHFSGRGQVPLRWK
ncbi:OmpH/Skp family outer membrane protein [Enterococcus sp. LJL128]